MKWASTEEEWQEARGLVNAIARAIDTYATANREGSLPNTIVSLALGSLLLYSCKAIGVDPIEFITALVGCGVELEPIERTIQ